jgi:hypothetical protein
MSFNQHNTEQKKVATFMFSGATAQATARQAWIFDKYLGNISIVGSNNINPSNILYNPLTGLITLPANSKWQYYAAMRWSAPTGLFSEFGVATVLGDTSVIPYAKVGRNPAVTAINNAEPAFGILFVEDKPLSFYLKNLANGTVTVVGGGWDGNFTSGIIPSNFVLTQVD